jgi:hypothetical protein
MCGRVWCVGVWVGVGGCGCVGGCGWVWVGVDVWAGVGGCGWVWMCGWVGVGGWAPLARPLHAGRRIAISSHGTSDAPHSASAGVLRDGAATCCGMGLQRAVGWDCNVLRDGTATCCGMGRQRVAGWDCNVLWDGTATCCGMGLQRVAGWDCNVLRDGTATCCVMGLQRVVGWDCNVLRDGTATCCGMGLQRVAGWDGLTRLMARVAHRDTSDAARRTTRLMASQRICIGHEGRRRRPRPGGLSVLSSSCVSCDTRCTSPCVGVTVCVRHTARCMCDAPRGACATHRASCETACVCVTVCQHTRCVLRDTRCVTHGV